MERPKRYTAEVLDKVTELLMPDVIRWTEENNTSFPEEELKADLRAAIQGNYDGYDIAKELDDESHWEVDANLVGILDNTPHLIQRAYSKEVQNWITTQNVKPKYQPGDKVKVLNKTKKEYVEGKILSVTEAGAYLVNVPKLGHKTEYEETGTVGTIINWETVEEWQTEETQAQHELK